MKQNNRFTVITANHKQFSFVRMLWEMDKIVYPESQWVSEEFIKSWFDKRPEMFNLLVDTHDLQIIGGIVFTTISEECFNNLSSLTLEEKEIDPDNFISPVLGEENYLYVASVIVHPKFQKTHAFKNLYDHLVSFIDKKCDQGIFYKNIIANIISQESAILAKNLQMKKCADYGNYYKLELYPVKFLPRTDSDKMLKKKYLTHQEEKEKIEYDFRTKRNWQKPI